MTIGLDAMDQAIETLAAVGGDQTAAMVEETASTYKTFMGKTNLIKLKASVKKALDAVSILMNSKEKRTMDSFLQAPFTGTYTSQSGEIVGILKNMKDTFRQNLEMIRSKEKAAQEAHAKFMKIKKKEYGDMKESYETKQGML